ncbi:MAG: hypothetical protein IPP83_15865 [Flavobacteriales bacterium]|nr:hypothetical protein [Flavobacteriales bacterium]
MIMLVGQSMVLVYKSTVALGNPKAVHVAAAIASKEVWNTRSCMPAGTRFWIGAGR